MKKILCVLFALVLTGFVFAAPGDTMYVSVKKTELKSGASSFDKTVASAAYGEELKVVQMKSKWIEVEKVSNPSVKGWVSSSSVTSKKIVASTSKGKVSASADEIALAGKGFSAQVESEYRSSNAKLNYASVDNMEQFVIKPASLQEFIVDGNLNGGE